MRGRATVRHIGRMRAIQAIYPVLLFCLTLLGCGDGIQRDAEGTPDLINAAGHGDLGQVKQLLDDGSPINVRDVCLRTPLMLAAQQGRLEAVRELLDRGAFPNLHEKGHYTALMLAASNDHHQIVQLLAERGADVDGRERTHGWTALIWAAKRGHRQTVQTLLELGADRSVRDNDGRTALSWARSQGFGAVLAELTNDDGLRHINAR